MPLDTSALRSLASSLDDLSDRLERLAANCDETEESAVDLREVHRQLETAARRLTSILRKVGS